MLNRMNLTLSALSNRLNLGTRSLVLNTSVNNGGQALCIRPSSHDHHVMREGKMWSVVSFYAPMKYDISPRPGSILPDSQQRPIRCASQEPGHVAFEHRVTAEPRSCWQVGQGFSVRLGAGGLSTSPTAKAAGISALKRRPGRCQRSAGDEVVGFAMKRAKACSAAAAKAALAEA
jgi:hypothetical protein